MISVGIDIGGQSVKAAVHDGAGWRWTGQSRFYDRPDLEALVSAMREAIGGQAASADCIGLCAPGFIDPQSRCVREAVNMPHLAGLSLDALLRDALGTRAPRPRIFNDTRAAAHDLFLTRGLGGRLLVLALGTGVGAAVLDDGVPLLVEGQTAGNIGQIDVSVPGHDVTAPDGGAGGLEGYIGARALARTYGPDVSTALSRFTGDEPPITALVQAIRIAHAMYRPHHIVLAGGIGIRLSHLLPAIRLRVERRLTGAARAGWTLAAGDSDYHAARGCAALAGEPENSST